MAYDYGERGGYRGRQDERGDWRGGGRREERGFFDRASDEVSSWFGDEEAERRREADGRRGEMNDRSGRDQDEGRHADRGHGDRDRFRGPEYGRGRDEWSGSGRGGRDERFGQREWGGGWFGRDRDDRPSHGQRDDGRGRQGSRFGGNGPARDDRGGDEYRPFAGDYGRGGAAGRDWLGRDDDRNRNERPSAAGGNHADPHYHEWRQSQIDSLDRDYEDYRRENQSRFASEFSSWRNQRQSKRQILGQVREHMEVVGNDDQRIGSVDFVRGDRVILTRTDPEANGVHRSFGCALIDRVDGDKLVLDRSADDARKELQREQGSDKSIRAAAPTSDDTGSSSANGPHALERSFSGTYR